MNIVVTIKQVPADPGAVKIDRETNTIVREGIPCVLNPYDLFAIEETLRIRERLQKMGAQARITAITMGPPQARSVLEEAIAMGVDNGILLSDRAFAGADVLATSYTLGKGIRNIETVSGETADLIICGRQSTDGDTAQVGPELAEFLGIPHVARVFAIDEIDTSSARVRRRSDEGYEIIQVDLPALFIVDKDINQPRVTSLKGMMRARKADIPTWGASDIGAEPDRIGLRGSPTKVIKVFSPEKSHKARFLQGSAEEVAHELAEILRKVLSS